MAYVSTFGNQSYFHKAYSIAGNNVLNAFHDFLIVLDNIQRQPIRGSVGNWTDHRSKIWLLLIITLLADASGNPKNVDDFFRFHQIDPHKLIQMM